MCWSLSAIRPSCCRRHWPARQAPWPKAPASSRSASRPRIPQAMAACCSRRRASSSPSASTRTRARPSAPWRLCNGGLMAIDGRNALGWLERPSGQRRARVLPDRPGRDRPGTAACCAAVVVPEAEVLGVNDRLQLAAPRPLPAAPPCGGDEGRRDDDRAGDRIPQPRHPARPATCSWSRNVVFGLGVNVESGAVIHAFSHLEGARVAEGDRGALCPPPAWREAGRQGQGRQFRRDQERGHRRRRQGQPPHLCRRRHGGRRRQSRGRHDHLQL